MSNRKQLGSIYTTYPAKIVGEWMGRSLFKTLASIFICIIWSGIYYVLVGVVNFLKNNFISGSVETTAFEMFQTEPSKWVLGITMVLITIWVFRSKIGEKQKPVSTRNLH